MRAFFNFLTTLALRFKYVTLLLAGLVMFAGVVAVSQLNQELLPPIEFPQTIILAQANGLTSEQVLTVLTERLEEEIASVEDVVNVESTTTGSFGAIITALNDFGIDRERLLDDLSQAVEDVWLPSRRIQAPEGQDADAFVDTLIADVTPEMLLYIAGEDANFLFQLTPDVWSKLSDETLESVLGYLANQVEVSDTEKSALQSLVEQEIAPQLLALDNVVDVQTSGGQTLPGQQFAEVEVDTDSARSLLLQLSPDVWSIVRERLGINAELDSDAVSLFVDNAYVIPEDVPELPASWQMDRFDNVSDILEARTITRTAAGVFNELVASNHIVAALGQTNDLTPDDLQRMLEIEPSMVEYFEAEQLVAMPSEVFAVLPEEFIANLDGFTRDALAAAELADEITGENVEREPVDLPNQWRIQPPQLLTFSFADIPLASFSVSTEISEITEEVSGQEEVDTATDASTDETQTDNETVTQDIPEGPAIQPLWALLGGFIGAELNTADDLINIELSEDMAAQFGGSSLSAADLFNFMLLLSDPSSLPEGTEMPSLPFDISVLISTFPADAFEFILENDPDFLDALSPEVYDRLPVEILALPDVSPPLASEWNALSEQPEFADTPLNRAGDIVTFGQPSEVLNTINSGIPQQYAGYEVRLFNSLTPGVLNYFAVNEEDFYSNLDSEVIAKFSPVGLQSIPDEVYASLDDDLAENLQAIASGEANSAFDDLRELYASDVPPPDPDAPVLNDDWAFIGNFLGVELDTADDFFRFYPDGEVEFLNSFFDSAQGISFAPNLFGNMSYEALDYMAQRDPNLLNELRIEALQLLSDDVLAQLPETVQERAAAGGEPFRPTNQVTRQNGAPSLLVTVYKDGEANTVATFYEAKAVIDEIQANNPDITVDVAFEQAGFVEESIAGVANEGTTGAIFAMLIIMLFLSGGQWNRGRRRVVGAILVALFVGILFLLTSQSAQEFGGDIMAGFDALGTVTRVLLIGGIIIGVVILLWPANLPIPAWRATLVIGVSIPLSIMSAFALMNWLPPAVNGILAPLAEDSEFFAFLIRLFPAELTLNIMTLSGLTVAVGRIVDDSIVVLENSFRHIQGGGEKRDAIVSGVREVSSAIFTATLIAVVVFLPLGLTGGLIGEFFLPFGLAVTYSLLSSFLVAIIVVPVLMFLFISEKDAPEDGDLFLVKWYIPVLEASLRGLGSKWIVIILAAASMMFGGYLLGQRPASFLPDLGEPQITINVNLPSGTGIIETNELVTEYEAYINELIPDDELETVQTIVGGGGVSFESLLTGGGVSENAASITLTVKGTPEQLDTYTSQLEAEAVNVFGENNVDVSLGSLTSSGFGGFALVVSGPIEDLEAYDSQIVEAIQSVEGIDNVTSNLTVDPNADPDAPVTYIRVDQQTALNYSGELSTDNTIGVTQEAIEAINAIPDFPDTLVVSQGFESEIQTEGFVGLFVAMGLAIMIVLVILVVYLQSPVYWIAIMLSVVVAPVGAAIALTLTDRVLGISALIGLLMLIGLVITNAIVLIDRVRQNNLELNMPLKDSLIEAGGRRMRPILMTALATIIALIPLASGWSGGGLIAEELGTVVIGGVFSSTLLTLIVVPVAYSLLTPLHRALAGILGRDHKE